MKNTNKGMASPPLLVLCGWNFAVGHQQQPTPNDANALTARNCHWLPTKVDIAITFKLRKFVGEDTNKGIDFDPGTYSPFETVISRLRS